MSTSASDHHVSTLHQHCKKPSICTWAYGDVGGFTNMYIFINIPVSAYVQKCMHMYVFVHVPLYLSIYLSIYL